MPFVNICTMKGALTSNQKKEIHQRLTDLLVEIEGQGNEIFRQFVWVMIEEEDPDNWSVGGNQISLEMLNSIREQSL